MHGFDPTDKGFYHGGDLAGITETLDYLEDMGVTADLDDAVVQEPAGAGHRAPTSAPATTATGSPTSPRSTRTSAPTRSSSELIDAGARARHQGLLRHHHQPHRRRHRLRRGRVQLHHKATEPYLDAAGQPFDDRDYVDGDTFPALDPAVSFPYTPIFPTAADETVKVPAWLNDPIYYHNRGNAAFDGGEGDLYGDFVGLDDLFTEHPDVRDGHDRHLRVLGRVRHRRVPHRHRQARQHGVLAEVRPRGAGRGARPPATTTSSCSARSSTPTRPPCRGSPPRAGCRRPSTSASRPGRSGFADGRPTTELRDLFAGDDYYTDHDSNAYSLPTFLGNHDMGRIGNFILTDTGGDADDATAGRATSSPTR